MANHLIGTTLHNHPIYFLVQKNVHIFFTNASCSRN